MKIIIVEDELHNFRLLKGMVNEIRPSWEIIRHFESVKKTVAWLSENPAPDLIFLDIQLGDGNCFSIFDQVEVSSMVIFTTAYNEYALQAFEVNSIDYLLKPIKENRLKEAIKKFERISKIPNNISNQLDYDELLKSLINGEKKYRKRFLIAGATSFSKINTENIGLFYTENRLTYAVTFDGKEHIIDQTMEKLEEQLDPDVFFRANRSTILNSDAVLKLENYFGGKLFVQLVNPLKEKITISRLKATEFKNWLGS